MSGHPLAYLLPILFLLGGCALPDLGDAPFFCNKGDPLCPEGYSCNSRNICVREGAVLPEPDTRPRRDVGPGTDEALADGLPIFPDGPVRPPDQKRPGDQPPTTGDQPPITPGQLVISELMPDPYKVPDLDGEWLELQNTGSQPIDINGWTLKDKNYDSHVINAGGSLFVPANGYLVLGRSADKLKNGGAPVQYAYGSSFTLANSSDVVILQNKSGTVVDSVTYSSTMSPMWFIPFGASLSYKGGDKNNPQSWCTETKTWAGSAGDKGTPGAPRGC